MNVRLEQRRIDAASSVVGRFRLTAQVRQLAALAAWGLVACAATPSPNQPAPATAPALPSAKAHVSPAEPADAPVPEPRTGEAAAEAGEPVSGQLVERGTDDGAEILAYRIQQGLGGHVRLDAPGGLAVLGRDQMLWVRRAPSAEPVKGVLLIPGGQHAGRRHPLALPAAGGTRARDAAERFYRAYAEQLSQAGGPFHRFAALRVVERFSPTTGARGGTRADRVPRDAMLRAMDTLSGRASIEEALQADRPLLLEASGDRATVAIDKVAGPPLATHPFPAMLRALGKPVPDEPLARVTPAAFWYARLDSLGALFRLEDELDAWATPLASAASERSEGIALSERYQAELGLRRGPLSRALGDQVVGQLALVGSDPYVRDGTDLSVIFQVRSRALFDAAVGATLADHGRTHGGLAETTFDHHGTVVRVATSRDGAVHQHRADLSTQAGELTIVSNSAGAIRRVLDAAAGRGPRLADEPDLRYLLARDAAVPANALVFLGDRFIAEVAGPRQKIAQLRRMIAQAELAVPGYAQLLYGQLHGRAPASTAELLSSRLLRKTDLEHLAGGAITFSPGKPARSRHGTPLAMVPLLDLPPVRLVTPGERDAYQRFAEGYQRYWRAYVDPVAARVRISGSELAVDVRVLPLIEATDYDKLQRMVGRARVLSPSAPDGARWVLGVGKDAELRRWLSGSARHTPFGQLAFDWLGDWAMAGIEDRSVIARFALEDRHSISQAPRREGEPDDSPRGFERIFSLPLYAGIEVRSTPGAIAFVAAIKQTIDGSAPGMLEWSKHDHRGVPMVCVRPAPGTRERERLAERGAAEAAVCYAITDGALLLALQERVLRRRIDERKDGKGAEAGKAGDTQLVFDVASRADAPIGRVFTWLLDSELQRSARGSWREAEVLLSGAPEARDPARYREVALELLGRVPLTTDGVAFTWTADGVTDPHRGTLVTRRWPRLPVAGSAVERLVSSLVRLRGEVGFDDEPGPAPSGGRLGSLHARLTVGLTRR